MPSEKKKQKPPALVITLRWSGKWPKAIEKQWSKLKQPRTVTFKLPSV